MGEGGLKGKGVGIRLNGRRGWGGKGLEGKNKK